MKRVDYVGRVFGSLTVVSRMDKHIHDRNVAFLFCRCECGIEKWIRYNNLVNETTTSCGCKQKMGLSKRSRKPQGHATSRAIWNYYVRNAKSRNIKWDLTFDQFIGLIKKPCHFCGRVNGTRTQMKFGDFLEHNGLDRFYNTLGYSVDNCVPCCKKCNIAKYDMHPKEFEEWIQDTYFHLFEREL